MPSFLKYFLIVLLFLSSGVFAQKLPQGSLVIVGGGLEQANKSVFTKLIALSGGAENASFAIIPSASGVAMQTFVSFSKSLMRYGVKPENIHLIKVAMADDDSTTDVNEALWSNNGNDPEIAAMVAKCSCIWFSGGDQLRTMKTLVNPDGTRTRVLQAVWDVFENGGVVGGTSAGAAIMSNPMIGAGNSMGALTHGVKEISGAEDFPEADGVLLTSGLGFFPLGMVDQHFNARARLGRLIVAMMNDKNPIHRGFGVDENTALIYNGKQKMLEVAGAAGVTFVNTTNATKSYHNMLPKIENIQLSYLEDGDTYSVATGEITPAEGKRPTVGHEFYHVSNPTQAGMLSGTATTFLQLITINLIDNDGVNKVQNINFVDENSGFMITLSKTNNSAGFYTDKPDGNDKYTVTNIRMDILPVSINLAPLK